jgi:hypothetical protein
MITSRARRRAIGNERRVLGGNKNDLRRRLSVLAGREAQRSRYIRDFAGSGNPGMVA